MDRRSEHAQAYRLWYKTKRWERMRLQQLARMPYCECPHHAGKCEPATVVDHKTPHRGDARLFWDVSNLQSLAKLCHDKFKHSAERGGLGFSQGSDVHGMPLVPQPGWSMQ